MMMAEETKQVMPRIEKEESKIKRGRSLKAKNPEKVLWQLQAIRRQAGITQGELAEKIGRSYYWYQQKENGDSPMTTIDIMNICDVLNISKEKIVDIFFV